MIGVVIHTYNEERNIKDCIISARLLSKEILVVDMYSKDNTVKIAKKAGVRVKFFPFHRYVEPAREFGIKNTRADWVFILDADERITKELAEEIKNRIGKERFSSYKAPRKNFFLGKVFMRHGGWYPDYQIRLLKKSAFVHWPEEIHSTPKIKGEQGILEQPILHFFHRDFNQMVEKTITFESIEANLLFEHNRKSGVFIFFRKFLGELYRRLIRNKGFLDGGFGVIEAFYQAYSKTITYIFLKELYEKKK